MKCLSHGGGDSFYISSYWRKIRAPFIENDTKQHFFMYLIKTEPFAMSIATNCALKDLNVIFTYDVYAFLIVRGAQISQSGLSCSYFKREGCL